MDADQVADLLGTVATAGALAVVAAVVARVAAPAALARFRASLAGQGPLLGAVVAGVAMAGSLWFSEGAGFPPCTLCWYQRIAMYPLALVLALAAIRREHGIRPYGVLLAGAGLAVSTWHNVIETFPDLSSSTSCDPTNPCTIRWVEGLGFWTIPRMAFVAFALVLTALLLDRAPAHPPEDP